VVEDRIHEVEIDLARCIERLDHNHECLELLKQNVSELTKGINGLEKTVLVKFGEMNGRDLQARRIAVVVSALVSLIVAGASVALAAIS